MRLGYGFKSFFMLFLACKYFFLKQYTFTNEQNPIVQAAHQRINKNTYQSFSVEENCVHDALEGIGRFADDGEVVDGIGSADPFQEITQRYFTLASIELQQPVYWY